MTTGLLNPTHIIILLIVVLIVLGPKRLPQAGRSLGRGMREFRDGITGHDEPPQPAEALPALMTAPPPLDSAPVAEQANSATEPTATTAAND